MIVLGSKAIGLAAAKVAAEVGPVRIVTIDDRTDARSEHAALTAMGATVGPIPDGSPVIVAGWYELLPRTFVESRTVVGIHHSLLPKYRGGAPVVWAMLNGETRIGTSLLRLTPGMDDGPLYGQASIDVGPDEAIGSVVERLNAEAVGLLREHLPGILAGEVPTEQEGEPSFCAQRHPGDGLIDWSLPARTLHDFIRAQSRPYPGAFTWRGPDLVRVWRACVFPYRIDGVPGTAMRVEGQSVVCCGGRTGLVLEEAEPVVRSGFLRREPVAI